jgi:large subunit ribosomal protein L21
VPKTPFLDSFGLGRHKHPPQVGRRRLAFFKRRAKARFQCGAFEFRIPNGAIDAAQPARDEKSWSGPTPIDHEDAPMFAVIRTGGKQYRVAAEDVIKVDKVKGNPGEIVQFGDVLVVGGDSITLGQPTISGASVAAEVLEQGRGPKIIAFKKRRRKNSRRKRGHRQEFTLVRVTEILTDGAKPSQTARPKREPKHVAAAPVEAAEPAKAEAPKPKVQAKTRAEGGAAKKPSKSPAKKANKPKSGSKGKKKG